jgi:hypothetical protein
VDGRDAVGNRSGFSNIVSTTTAQAPANPVVNEPPTLPVSIISFPSRDFISSEPLLPTDTVNVSVIRKGQRRQHRWAADPCGSPLNRGACNTGTKAPRPTSTWPR